MKITIITVCYQSAATLADTLASVKAQTYAHIEHLLVDGGSSDGSVAMIQAYAAEQGVESVKWISEKDQGLYDAMNKGLAMSSGDWVGFLNADDFFADKEVVARIVASLESSKADCIYSDLVYVHPQNTRQIVRRWKSGQCSPQAFLWGWMPPHPTFYVKKAIYDRLGGYRLDMGSAADYELMLRFLHKNRISWTYLKIVSIHMRAGGVSNAGLKNRLKANQNDRKAWKLNGLKPYFFTLWLKPLRKITQFLPF